MEVSVLGPLVVRLDDREQVVTGARRRALLARLALDANRPVAAERLVDDLWGGDPPPAAGGTLQSHVSQLRKVLGASCLQSRPGAYELVVPPAGLDTWQFEADVTAARAAVAEDAVGLLDRALSRWRGRPYLDAGGAAWAAPEVARLEELRLAAVEALLDARLALGQFEQVAALGEATVAEHPLRERAWAALMTALYRSGRQAEALRAFQRVRTVLADGVGVAPSPELVALEAQILRQDPALDGPRPAELNGGGRGAPVGARRGSALPTGTVTFLFTDLEGSTRLWEAEPEAMTVALQRHDEVLRDAVEVHGGYVVKTTGDGVLASFASAPHAVLAAVEAQRTLVTQQWPTSEPVRVRMGVHTGDVEVVDGDYHGPPVNRAARIMSVAHGGQILVSQVTKALAADVLPADLRLIDLGDHQLRDLSRPEHIFQIVGEGLPARVGDLRSLDAFPGNLPVHATSFVGREQEIERIAAAFDERRLVTITGVGGVGKTRLALQVAAELLPRFSNGAWICELAAASDEDTMHAVVAATIGVKPRTGLALDAAILEALRDRELLVVLDNCEHLLSAAGALSEGLLRRCPGVTVLATSREGLGVDGEQVWPLRSLTVPDDSIDVSAVARTHAAQLFADRARAAQPNFAINDRNVASVVEICRRLDGMPLAIELAAARLAAMSPSEIARMLDERFRLLTGGRRTAVERHQTLRATVDWSYSLLEPNERLVFDRLAVFAGTFDAASAAAVVSGDGVEQWDVREALMALVAKSLVVAEPSDDDQTRYWMLETLRQYAREQLDATDTTDAWRRRHAAHYADFAETAGPALLGAEEIPWRRRVGLELDNLRAAVTWGLDSVDDEDADFAIRIIAALAFEATMRRSSGLARWAEQALPRLAATTPGRRAAVIGTAAYGATFRGDYDAAGVLAEESLRDEITLDFPAPNQGVVVSCMVHVYRGDTSGAVAQALSYADMFDARGLRIFDRANIRVTAGIWAIFADDLDVAKREAGIGLELAQEIANPSSIAMASFVLGWAVAREDPETAIAHLERSVALTRSGASDVVLGSTLSHLAGIKARQGDQTALPALREALRHNYDDGDLGSTAGTIEQAVVVAAYFGEFEVAAVLGGCLVAGAMTALLLGTPDERAERDVMLERTRAELGDVDYDAAFAAGASMPYDQVVAFALEWLDSISPP